MRLVWIVFVLACSAPQQARREPPSPSPSPSPVPVAVDPFAAQNLGFERVDGDAPAGWEAKKGAPAPATVTSEHHGGSRALVLAPDTSAVTKLDAARLVGKRVTVHGFIKTRDAGGAALLVRADDAAGMGIALEQMTDHRVTGTTEWAESTITLDVPASATSLVIGVVLLEAGAAWFDDLRIEVADIRPPTPIVLEGTVIDPDGKPAADADVALIGETEITQHVRTTAQGRFHFDTVAGKWGISANKRGTVAAFLAQAAFAASATELRVALGKDGGVTIHGRTSQKPKPGSYVQISPISDNDADVFAVRVADDGTFEAILPRGDHYFAAMMGGFGMSNFDRAGDRAELVIETVSFEPPPAEVTAYIAAHAVPLATADPAHALDDLAPLGPMIGKARIVALGEATHGSREFFQLKHRFLEYLVAKQGFTVFAIEANQPECRAINDYVVNGKGDARTALAGIYFWTWNTEEVLAMIEWMRAWNADPAHTKKIQFTGFDMQTSKVAHANVAAFVDRVAPDQKALLAPIAALGETSSSTLVAKLDPLARKALTAGLAALAPVLDAHKGADGYLDARHDLRVLEQATALYFDKEGFNARDAAMAENVGWLADTTKAKLVLWAHNGHVANKLAQYANMGSHLRAKYKQQYLNFGFLIGEGSFQAIDMTKHVLAEHTFPPPQPFHASVAFAGTGTPLLVLDLRALPKRGPVRTWFDTAHMIRDVGAVYGQERFATTSQVLPQLYDALIYVERTTRARPLEKL